MVFRRNATYRCNRIPQCGSITLARRLSIYKRIDTCTHAHRTDTHTRFRAHATHDRPVLRRRRNVPPIPLTSVFPQLVGGPPPPSPPPQTSSSPPPPLIFTRVKAFGGAVVSSETASSSESDCTKRTSRIPQRRWRWIVKIPGRRRLWEISFRWLRATNVDLAPCIYILYYNMNWYDQLIFIIFVFAINTIGSIPFGWPLRDR